MPVAVQPQSQRLEFNEQLLPKNKRENTDSLLKRLQSLHAKLQVLEQDITESSSLDPITKPLIDNKILHATNKGVKAVAACCLADVLRLYAPEAPYDMEELRDIFQFMLAQLATNLKPLPPAKPLQPSKGKANESQSQTQTQTQTTLSQKITEIPYFKEYCFLLDSLASIRSVVLVWEVPGGEELVTSFFEGFVSIVRPDMSKSVIRHLVTILAALIEEGQTVPSGVMDCIIRVFDAHTSGVETPAFQLIVDVCNTVPQHLQRPVLAHLSEIQLAHGRNPDTNDMEVLTKSHQLALKFSKYCPELLNNYMPMLEESLRAADEIFLRQLTTKTLGSMFGQITKAGTSPHDTIRKMPNTWKAWLGRRVDRALQVRLAWVESTYDILANVPEVRKELEKTLRERLTDSNEQIRAAICTVLGKLHYETVLHHIDLETLQALSARMGDKKLAVRAEAAAALGRWWTAAYIEIDSDDTEAVRKFAWFPQALLHCMHKKSLPVELRTQMTALLRNVVLPLPQKADDETEWVNRLLLVASHIDESAMNTLLGNTNLLGFARGSYPYRAFVATCEENNGGIIDKDEQAIKARLNFLVDRISAQLYVDVDKARKDMEAFASYNDARLYKLFRSCADPQSDLRTLIKSRNEFIRRVEQSHTDILDTFTTLIDSASFSILNPSSISPLLKALQSPPPGPRKDAVASAAARFLSFIAKECSPMFVNHVPGLLVTMSQQKNDKLVEVSLQALAAVCKVDPSVAPKDERYAEKAIKIALKGTPRQAKFAARYLAYSGVDGAPAELLEAILNNLTDEDESRLLPYLRALSELSLSSPAVLETQADEVHRFVMQNVIYKESPSADDTNMDEWCEEQELEILDRAKLVAIRLLTHRTLGFARAENVLQIAEPVLALLDGILRNDGQISEKTQEGGRARTHLRLRVALCLLKLANVKAIDRKMTPFFEPISYVMQDACYMVRHNLLRKLGEVLPAQRLLPRWNIMPAMLATDPEPENPLMARAIMSTAIRSCSTLPTIERIDRIELPLSRLLLVLSHHPDLEEWSHENTKDMIKYIDLYLDSVINRDNIGLLYFIAAKVKSVKGLTPDGEVEEDNLNLYKLAELTQIAIKKRAEQHHWSLTTYPGKIKLPKDIFHNLENNQAVLEASRKTYLTESEAGWARESGRKTNAVAGPSRRANEGGSSPVKKRARTSKGARKRTKRSEEDDESEDEDDDDEEASDEEEDAEAEEEASEDEGQVVVGRGGKRGAKTKAKKGIRGKKTKAKQNGSKVASKSKAKSKSETPEGMDVDQESELSDAESE